MNLIFSTQKYFFCKKLPNLKKYGDIKFNFKDIVNNLSIHQSNIKNRKINADVELVSKLYNEYMTKLNDINLMRQQINKLKQINSQYSKEGKEFKQITKDTKKHQEDIDKFSKELQEIEHKMLQEALNIPNLTDLNSPVGGEKENKIIKVVGKKRNIIF